MSNTSNATPATDITVEAKSSKIKSTLQKGANFVKNHKKSTIAVGILVGLVGANVILEKKTGVSFAPDSDVEVHTTENGFEVVDTSSN